MCLRSNDDKYYNHQVIVVPGAGHNVVAQCK